MQPRTEGRQRCLSFQLSVDPRTRVYQYRDYLGNTVHHFDVPGKHLELQIVAEALVEMSLRPSFRSDWRLRPGTSSIALGHRRLLGNDDAQPVRAAHDALLSSIEPLQRPASRRSARFLRELNASIYNWFDYVPKATRVDSPIDHAIETRRASARISRTS